jgi:uncharacterized integral membrane protein
MKQVMKHWKLILAMLGAVLVIIIILQNTESVETRLLFMRVSMPRAILLFIACLIGFVVGMITTLTMQRAQKAKSG